jgi:hypothetical protein
MGVKYSVSAIPNTIKSNNIVFNLDNGDYGPSPITGFWSGIDPPTSGYTIYTLAESAEQSTVVVAHNDAEAIYFAKSFGGTNVNTIGDALWYLVTGSTNTTVVNMVYPNIVMNGLVVNLDAGFVPSYPRTGNLWRDISGNGYDATIINTVPFVNKVDYGEFVFNGTIGNRIDCGTNYSLYLSGSTDFTIECMAYPEATQPLYADIWGNHNEPFTGLVLQQNGAFPNSYVYSWSYGDGTKWVGTPNFTLSGSSYNHIVAIKNGINSISYVNGIKVTDTDIASNGVVPNTSYNFQIGIGWHLDSIRYFNGKISSFRIYDRALSPTEVTQNYNAIKSRFGL